MQRRDFLRKGLMLGATALCPTDELLANSTTNAADSTDGSFGISKVITYADEPASPPIIKYVSSHEKTMLSPEIAVEPLEIKIGEDLIPLFDPQQGGDMLDRLHRLRKEVTAEIGLILPKIRVRDEPTLGKTDYRFHIDGQSVAQWSIFPDRYFAIPGDKITKKLRGIETIEPAFGTPALWIDESDWGQAWSSGYTVVEPSAVITTHFFEMVRRHTPLCLAWSGGKPEEAEYLIRHRIANRYWSKTLLW